MKKSIIRLSVQFFSLTMLLLLIGCGNSNSNHKGTLIDGNISDAGNIQIFLDRMSLNNEAEVIGKSTIESSGDFSIAVEEGTPEGIYRVRLGAQRLFFVLDENDKGLNIEGTLDDIKNNNLKLKGSPTATAYYQVISDYFNKRLAVNDVPAKISGMENTMAAALAGMQLLASNPASTPTLVELVARMNKEYPNSQESADFGKYVGQIQAQRAQARVLDRVKVGQPAPDITLPDPNGKTIKLSDLKGQVVLLDFWASWCGPCRRANPKVVETYKKYNPKGFNVYSVSLDGIDSRTAARYANQEGMLEKQQVKQKERWLEAIKKDNLIWNTHVSDLKKWDCVPAKEYGVKGIPRTFLINREGIIAAINPRFNLEEEVAKLL